MPLPQKRISCSDLINAVDFPLCPPVTDLSSSRQIDTTGHLDDLEGRVLPDRLFTFETIKGQVRTPYPNGRKWEFLRIIPCDVYGGQQTLTNGHIAMIFFYLMYD